MISKPYYYYRTHDEPPTSVAHEHLSRDELVREFTHDVIAHVLEAIPRDLPEEEQLAQLDKLSHDHNGKPYDILPETKEAAINEIRLRAALAKRAVETATNIHSPKVEEVYNEVLDQLDDPESPIQSSGETVYLPPDSPQFKQFLQKHA